MAFSAPVERLRRWLQPKSLTLIEACLIGLVSGLAAVCLQRGINWLGSGRIYWATHTPAIGHNPVPAFVVLGLIGAVGGLISGWLIERFAPEASGSGIPQVKAALAQFPVRLNGQVALVKLLSGILALGSGLSLGRQGPTVQIGAALAAQMSYWVPTAPGHRRQMIAAGAGAGLAAGFNTPLAGVLFVVEELLGDVSGLTLGTAILSSFIGAVVARTLGGQGLAANLSEMSAQTSFVLPEIPFYILLGTLAGLFGGLFNQGVLGSLALTQRFLPIGLPRRIALAGLCSGTILGLLPTAFQNLEGLRLWISMGEAGLPLIALAFVARFGLSLVAFGSGAPGGLFAPSLVLGAALGQMVGLLQAHVIAAGLPQTYALVGMGAFFGAVSRVPFTGIVIVFEITTDFNLVLPLMMSSVVAYLVADKISPGSLYLRLLKRQGIELSPHSEVLSQGLLDRLTAADIMERRVETLSSDLPLHQARNAFARSHHRGFPVVEQGRLVGILTQTDLTQSQSLSLLDNTPIREIMTAHPVAVAPTDPLSAVLYTLNRFAISRLPVVEGRKLVGIITRADIIRAESQAVSGAAHFLGTTAPNPSYLVYQTQGPSVGKGRILVPLANPETSEVLLQLAVAIARERDYEVECLQVIQLPRSRQPSETPVKTTRSRRLLQRAMRYGQRHRVAVHTQVRLGHDIAQTILEVEKQRHIDLIIMGWQGYTPANDRLFGSTVDVILRQAASPVLLFKGPPTTAMLKRWLVPVAGGPNTAYALTWLPPLVNVCGRDANVHLCQIQKQGQKIDELALVQTYVERLEPYCRGTVKGMVEVGEPVAAILDLSQRLRADVIVLGASRAGLFSQIVQGNIPELVARQSDCAILLVRGPTMTEEAPLSSSGIDADA
jgi:CIC family chloride channel protein